MNSAPITCSASQIGPTTYAFTFDFQVPMNQPAPSLWVMRIGSEQDAAEPVANNVVETGVSVEILPDGPMVFRSGFED